MSGIVGSKFNHRGSGVVASVGTDGQTMLSSGAGKKHIFETVATPSGGLDVADVWRVNSGATTSATGTTLTANWESADDVGQGSLGTGMTESSGVFTWRWSSITLWWW